MKISILIPTYRRSKDLQACLESLKQQARFPDQIVVTVRDTDTETQDFLAAYDKGLLPLESVSVTEEGVVAAMNKGLTKIEGDIVALIDDDTTPWKDWLQQIEGYFAADAKLGGVGGRDWQPYERWDNPVVGKIQWFGRIIGNHHVGCGPAREVDLLKGANCAYRTAPLKEIGFDTRLRGRGAQVHWELSLGFAMKKRGWKLIYDPQVCLDHHIGVRFDEDQLHRQGYNAVALENVVYNESIIMLENLSPVRRRIYLVWATLIGTKGDPGFVQLVRLLLKRDKNAVSRFQSTRKGRADAVRFQASEKG